MPSQCKVHLPWLIVAAALPLGDLSVTAPYTTGVCAAGTREHFRLQEKWDASPDSKLLRFSLPHKISSMPSHTGDGAYLAPTGVYCISNVTAGDGELKKSYSPVSLPDAAGHLDLLVKAYKPRPGGGLGAHLCALQPGDQVLMEIKPPRAIHGDPVIASRWKRLGFVAGGTGVAPMVQMIRFLLSQPEDKTELWLLSINRYEHDILMRGQLEELAAKHPGRLHLTFSCTKPPEGWQGAVGRGSVSLAREALPAPSDSDVMIMVCGTDGFVDTWAGATQRETDPTTGQTKKVQGPLTGFLAAVGFQAHQVYKF